MRRIKARLSRMTPDECAKRLNSWQVGAARIDALAAISSARASGKISSKYFQHLDFRIDNKARELLQMKSISTASLSLPEMLMRKARKRKQLRTLPLP